jgi:uncharacterized protein (TIGR02145 family)
MRTLIKFYCLVTLLVFFNSCKKEAPDPPTVTTAAVNDISYTTATAGGNVTSEGGAAVMSRGVCWNTSAGPTIDNTKALASGTTGEFTASLTQLTPSTAYYVRAYATNSGGTSYGQEVSFTTKQVEVPSLNTETITSIAITSAVSGGNITDEKGSPVTARGVCWSTNENPVTSDNKTSDGTGTGSFVSTITGLQASTVYYLRAYATNSAGTSYGSQITFKTFTLADVDNNYYNTVTIGTQTWMSENLRTTKFNDNTVIPCITDDSQWSALTTPAYCWYNNDETSHKNTYGAMYNWFVVNSGGNGGKNVCPVGWHVPSSEEFGILSDFLGGETVAGGKLKEEGITHWTTPNTSATNETGFTALPGGHRLFHGAFGSKGFYGSWWTVTEHDVSTALSWFVSYDLGYFKINLLSNKLTGIAIRCVKD